jgi:hypothetical protein
VLEGNLALHDIEKPFTDLEFKLTAEAARLETRLEKLASPNNQTDLPWIIACLKDALDDIADYAEFAEKDVKTVAEAKDHLGLIMLSALEAIDKSEGK